MTDLQTIMQSACFISCLDQERAYLEKSRHSFRVLARSFMVSPNFLNDSYSNLIDSNSKVREAKFEMFVRLLQTRTTVYGCIRMLGQTILQANSDFGVIALQDGREVDELVCELFFEFESISQASLHIHVCLHVLCFAQVVDVEQIFNFSDDQVVFQLACIRILYCPA